MVSNKRDQEGIAHRKITRQAWFGLIIGIVCLFLGLYFARESYIFHVQIEASKTWPEVTGEVIETKISMIPDNDGSVYYYPIVIYHYIVSGAEYTCDYGLDREGFRDDAEGDLRSFPIGTEIKVSYNPNRPQDCITKHDAESFPFGAIIFILTGTFLVIYDGLIILGKVNE